MAYNKSKHVETAQKLLNQGKVPQAIAEYQQILKYEPRDPVTLMTVGELYIRQGETFQAIDYFERLAQLFVSDGFLTKAIAVYKRIAKLAPEEIRPLEKLADLYVQQGVMSEARPLFLQLAEIHLKSNRQPEAVSLLKKLLLAEPDNLRIQVRLADLYQAMGQTKEAIEAYVSAAQRSLARGDQAECDKLSDKALKLEPNNVAAIIVKARAQTSQNNFTAAAHLLEKVPDIEKGGESAELLLDLYLKNSNWKNATALALRIYDADAKNFSAAQKTVEALLHANEGEAAMSILERLRVPMIDAGEHEVMGRLLNELAAALPGQVAPLEWLVDMYGRTSDSFRLPDALANLGEALAASGQLERAKQVLEQLVEREPESDSAKRKLNNVLRQMGLAAPEPAGEIPEATLPTELAMPAPPKIRPDFVPNDSEVVAPVVAGAAESPLDSETQKFIAQSLTDVDLFASYGLTQKAISLLEAILRRAPRHTPTLEKLLDFVLGAGDDRRTAELAALLETIHQDHGDARGAERFGELRRRFQRAAGLTDKEIDAFIASVPHTLVPAAPLSHAQDLSAETIPEVFPEEAEPKIHDAAAAIPAADHLAAPPADFPEFLMPADLPETSGETLSAGPNVSAPQHAEFDISPETLPVPEQLNPFAEISAELPDSLAAESLVTETTAPESDRAPESARAIEEHILDVPMEDPALEVPPAVVGSTSKDSEFELDEDFDLILESEPLVPAHEQRPPETPVAAQPETAAPRASSAATPAPPSDSKVFASDQFLADLASELDELGLDALIPTAPNSAVDNSEAPVAAKTEATGPTGPLQEVFDQFRAELGEMGAEDEDLETHYNLGIAFREMGLVEESISEFQKVAKAMEKGKSFRYGMQCCTLLGLAFIEKGQPAIAAIWYERALLTPGIDSESLLALRYDLGMAQESAGEMEAARKSFSQVYAVNIDYRDVAERIAALQKPSR
jgi:tetratricopeptide (TPR) repeat protein